MQIVIGERRINRKFYFISIYETFEQAKFLLTLALYAGIAFSEYLFMVFPLPVSAIYRPLILLPKLDFRIQSDDI